ADAFRSPPDRAGLWTGGRARIRVLRRLARALLVRPDVSRRRFVSALVRRSGDDARAHVAPLGVTVRSNLVRGRLLDAPEMADEPPAREPGDRFERARLFEQVRRAGNDLETLLAVQTLVGLPVQL